MSCGDTQFARALHLLFLVCILQEYNLPKDWNPHSLCSLLYSVFPITPGKTGLCHEPVGLWLSGSVGLLLRLVIWVGSSELTWWKKRNGSLVSCSLIFTRHTHPWPARKEMIQNCICKFISLQVYLFNKKWLWRPRWPRDAVLVGQHYCTFRFVVVCFSVIGILWRRESEYSSGDFGELCPAMFA